MNGKKLIVMAAVLALLAGIVLLQKAGNGTIRHTGKAESTLLAGIDLNAVTGLDITKGGKSARLAKTNAQWKIAALSGYPVDFGKLADAIRTIAELKLSRPLRSGNVAPSEYGFGENQLEIVMKTGDRVVATLDVGAQRTASAGGTNQHFVRKAGSDAIYLVDYDFRPFSETPEEWIHKQLLNIRSEEIVAVDTGAAELKTNGTDWTLTGLDQTTEELQSAQANKLRGALQYFMCDTIADKTRSDEDLGFTGTPEVYTASTTNKTIKVIFGGETDNGRYIRLGGDIPDAVNGWTYVISSSKAADLMIKRNQLVKPKASSAAKDGAPPKKTE